jgi:hypothetical protein
MTRCALFPCETGHDRPAALASMHGRWKQALARGSVDSCAFHVLIGVSVSVHSAKAHLLGHCLTARATSCDLARHAGARRRKCGRTLSLAGRFTWATTINVTTCRGSWPSRRTSPLAPGPWNTTAAALDLPAILAPVGGSRRKRALK